MLSLPVLSLGVERNVAVQPHPRLVNANQLFPLGVPLGRCQIRILVDDVLEMIDHRAVGDEGQAAGQMGVEILLGVLAEELLGKSLRKVFHRHRVHLAGLKARRDGLHRHAVAIQIALERVTGLVGHDLDIVLGVIEVRENERRVVIRNFRTVAAALLALGGEQVHEFIVNHVIEELGGLRGTPLVKMLCRRDNVVRRALRLRIARAELHRIVGVAHRVGLAEALCLSLVDLDRHRHHVLLYGLAELLDIGLVIAVSLHAAVADRQEIVVAELFADGISKVHQLVIESVKLFLVVLVPLSLRLPGCEASRIVRVILKRRHLRNGIDTALKRNLCAREQLLVSGDELVLLLKFRDNRRREGLQRELRIGEKDAAVLLLKLLAEGRSEQSLGPLLAVLLNLRRGIVPVVLFLVVKLVRCVNRMANRGKGGHRRYMSVQLVDCEESCLRLCEGLCLLQRFDQLLLFFGDALNRNPLVLHFLELHAYPPWS